MKYLKGSLKLAKGVAKIGSSARKGVQFSETSLKNVHGLYSKKAGKIEMHHPIPKYLGGEKKQDLVPLDGAYHQQITNEFRKLWGYGKSKPSNEQLQRILKEVYNKFPLPKK